MITVTKEAKKRIKEIIQQQTIDSEVAIRITFDNKHLKFGLSDKKEKDYVVKNAEGMNLLFIGNDSLFAFKNSIIYYRKAPSGSEFIIEKT